MQRCLDEEDVQAMLTNSRLCASVSVFNTMQDVERLEAALNRAAA
jgi:hypothetical protein